MNISVVPFEEKHLKGIAEVENRSFSTPWSEKSFSDELTNNVATYFVAISEDKVVGYIGFWTVADEADITNVAVLPEYRKSGIGSILLKETVSYCISEKLVSINLEVRESNSAAKNLYSKFGFIPIGLRKRYYSNPVEDAIIMSLSLNQERNTQNG